MQIHHETTNWIDAIGVPVTPGKWCISPDGVRIIWDCNVGDGQQYLHPIEPRIGTKQDEAEIWGDLSDDFQIADVSGEPFNRPADEVAANVQLLVNAPYMLAIVATLAEIVQQTRDAEKGDMERRAALLGKLIQNATCNGRPLDSAAIAAMRRVTNCKWLKHRQAMAKAAE